MNSRFRDFAAYVIVVAVYPMLLLQKRSSFDVRYVSGRDREKRKAASVALPISEARANPHA